MLSAVGSKWITMLAGAITAVVLVAAVMGLASPDGSVGDPVQAARRPGPTTAAPSATPTTPAAAVPNARLAPAATHRTWPGRPAEATLEGSTVDWCGAVRTSGDAEARQEFGSAAVRAAACTAVRFVFEQRYSRLSLPRSSYDAADLDFVLPTLAPSTVDTYRPRIARFVAQPDSVDAREDLGLVLFRGEGTPAGARHATAGNGRVFYGPAYSTAGYRHRAAWINPTWSRVRIRVDRSKAAPRIVATLDASAAMPVFDPTRARDDMLTVPTHATFILRRAGGTSWRIGGWDITGGTYDYARLRLG
jgi:hypothetical protein